MRNTVEHNAKKNWTTVGQDTRKVFQEVCWGKYLCSWFLLKTRLHLAKTNVISGNWGYFLTGLYHHSDYKKMVLRSVVFKLSGDYPCGKIIANKTTFPQFCVGKHDEVALSWVCQGKYVFCGCSFAHSCSFWWHTNSCLSPPALFILYKKYKL